jgi:hypothetical protein
VRASAAARFGRAGSGTRSLALRLGFRGFVCRICARLMAERVDGRLAALGQTRNDLLEFARVIEPILRRQFPLNTSRTSPRLA